LSGPQGPRSLVQEATSSSYQFSRIASRGAGFSVFPVSVNRQVRVIEDRLNFSSELCEQGRSDSFLKPLLTCYQTSSLLHAHLVAVRLHTWRASAIVWQTLYLGTLCLRRSGSEIGRLSGGCFSSGDIPLAISSPTNSIIRL
jgi:hypothetical protein